MRRRQAQYRENSSRRLFLARAALYGTSWALAGSAWGCRNEADRPSPPSRKPLGLTTSHRTFTSEEYAIVSAACERILPRDEDPGALDAAVPEYVDRALTSPAVERMKEDFLAGTAALNRRSKRLFGKGFAEASPVEQDQALTIFKDSRPGSGEANYYEILVVLTLEGFLGDPSYGGNKDHVGWQLVGFQTAEPPPGHDGIRAASHCGKQGT